jgi:hypothetical protein
MNTFVMTALMQLLPFFEKHSPGIKSYGHRDGNGNGNGDGDGDGDSSNSGGNGNGNGNGTHLSLQNSRPGFHK